MPRQHPQDRWNIPESQWRKTARLARDLRTRHTPSEQLLWSELRGQKIDGIKFR